jgi:hypothetical protein
MSGDRGPRFLFKVKFALMKQSPLIWFALILLVVAAITAVGPAEKTLGANVRVVYLHGAWVWAALFAFVAAGLSGIAGLVTHKDEAHAWSRAFGRTGLFFWITYLPISIWAMQTNWNGLFLAEPRFRLAVIFAISGLLLQLGLALIESPLWTSAGNLLYLLALLFALFNTPNVMHPSSPIFSSDSWRIQIYFAGLVLLTLLGVWQIARWLFQVDRARLEVPRR